MDKSSVDDSLLVVEKGLWVLSPQGRKKIGKRTEALLRSQNESEQTKQPVRVAWLWKECSEA